MTHRPDVRRCSSSHPTRGVPIRARILSIGLLAAACGLLLGLVLSQRLMLALIAAVVLAGAVAGSLVALRVVRAQQQLLVASNRLLARSRDSDGRLKQLSRGSRRLEQSLRAAQSAAARADRRLARHEGRIRREVLLTDLAQQSNTDKWGVHFYTPHYQRHLEHLREEAFTLLEIGVGGYDRHQQGGGSLRMWKRYFHRAQIIGLDIEDKSFVDGERVLTIIGSQTDDEVLRRIVREHGAPRVVIDDGSHVPEDIIKTFHALFPLLPDGAVYAIEDTQTSYWPEWGGRVEREAENTTMWLVKQLVDGLNYEEYVDDDYVPTYSDQHVVAVHCYHNLVIIEKGDNAEGTNKRQVLRERYPSEDPPARPPT